MITPVLITGFLRSGTTLLEKYLHNHPQMVVASQPFPFLYSAVKEAFYRHLHAEVPRYPLGHLFGERLYLRRQFLEFVMQYRMNAQEVRLVMERMRSYSGQLTQNLLDLPVPEGTFSMIFNAYAEQYPYIFNKPQARYSGAKEVFCEEFIPCFLRQAYPAILIIRDPRAVVASIHGGKGANYANSGLSVLHILRSWRKSVAYAIHHAKHPHFFWLRYEQLVHSPEDTLQTLAQGLGLAPFPYSVLRGDLQSQNGTTWSGNSSFEGPEAKNDRYRELLGPETIAFIDTVCDLEMRWLGIHHEPQNLAHVLGAFRDPFQPKQPALSPEDKHMETTRLDRMVVTRTSRLSEEEVESWFIFPSVQPVLHKLSQIEDSL